MKAIKDIIAKTQRVDAAARRERLQGPEVIQKTKAVRHPARDEGLIGWWDFCGDLALDLSGYGNHGTFYGTADAVDDRYSCPDNVGNNYVSYGVTPDLMPPSITISLWMRRTAWVGADLRLLWGVLSSVKDGVVRRGVGIFESAGGIYANIFCSASWFWIGPIAVADMCLVHVVMTYDGFNLSDDNFKLYINGKLEASAACQWGALTYPSIIDIRSGMYDPGFCFNGEIDRIKVFGRCFKPWEAHRLYEEENHHYIRSYKARVGHLWVVNEATIGDGIVLSGDVQLSEGVGNKIGTTTATKMAFYGASPVDQPDTVADAATQDLTGGDTIDKAKTQADLTSCKDAINTLIDRLQELGFLA